jgi:hypothetical protein
VAGLQLGYALDEAGQQSAVFSQLLVAAFELPATSAPHGQESADGYIKSRDEILAMVIESL